MHVVIHLDPVVTADAEINAIHSEVADIVGKVSAIVGYVITMHDFRVVRGQTHTNLIFDIAVPCDSKYSDHEIREMIETRIHELSPTYNSVITCDRCYSQTVEKLDG